MPHDLAVLLGVADPATAPADIGATIGPFLQYGVTGVVVIMLIFGIIAPKYVVTSLTQERDNWRDAYEKEREAHQATRLQLSKAEERGDLAVEQGRVLNKMLAELGHRPERSL